MISGSNKSKAAASMSDSSHAGRPRQQRGKRDRLPEHHNEAPLGDWRGESLGRMRKLIKEADPDVVEIEGKEGT